MSNPLDRSYRVEFEGSFPTVRKMPGQTVPEIAFAGRSNVGKSSCINALLNRRKLARVSQSPGRTRLLNVFTVDETIRFVDLPGYGFARVPLKVRESWGPMVSGYLQQREALALLVLLLDLRREPSPEDRMLASWLAARQVPVLVVLTKSDKVSRNQRMKRMRTILNGDWIAGPPAVFFSAPKREGVLNVWNIIRGAAGVE